MAKHEKQERLTNESLVWCKKCKDVTHHTEQRDKNRNYNGIYVCDCGHTHKVNFIYTESLLP